MRERKEKRVRKMSILGNLLDYFSNLDSIIVCYSYLRKCIWLHAPLYELVVLIADNWIHLIRLKPCPQAINKNSQDCLGMR